MKKSQKPNEFDLIAKYFAPLSANFAGALGLKDDAAIITPKPNCDLVVTKDALVADVHFFKNDSPYNIALKLLGVNVSDLASMGAKPIAYLLAIAMPKNTDDAWLQEFSQGFAAGIAEFGGALIGGDTVSHDGALTLSLTAIGEVKQGDSLKRSGAKIGDLIFASGTIGDSYLGLQILKDKAKLTYSAAEKYLIDRYYIPRPRVKLGQKLVGIAGACIDISDGLVADLGHICECSNVGAEIELANVPLSAEALAAGYELTDLITGGDDYELLFTVPENMEKTITDLALELEIPLTKIGKITSGSKVKVLDKNGDEVLLEKSGYRHF